MTVLVVAGTRPEVVKLAPVVDASKFQRNIRTVFCLTGQHRDLADDVSCFFGLNADYRLDAMREDQDASGLMSRILTGLRPVLRMERPDVVIVQGDTITCFASAMAAFLEGIPVCHVEAGLRTHDLAAPFPEEALRQMVARIAALHCAATAGNRDNLLAEGVAESSIVVTGNTVIDALHRARVIMGQNRGPFLQLSSCNSTKMAAYARTVLVTVHRREHFGDKLVSICQGLLRSAIKHPDVLFVCPVHPNPNVVRMVRETLRGLENIMLLQPVSYPGFISLMTRCYLVVTDSGGIQEEAPALGKPVVVIRDRTERQEALATGQAVLAGTSANSIVNTLDEILDGPELYSKMVQTESPYGDGKAAGRIVSSVLRFAGTPPTGLPLANSRASEQV